MVTHGNLRYITHEIIQPVVQPSQHGDGFIHITQSDAHCRVRIVSEYRQVATQQHPNIFKRPCYILRKPLFGLEITIKI